MTQKPRFGGASRSSKPSLLAGNRFQTLSCDPEDMYRAEFDYLDETEFPPSGLRT